MLYKGRRYSLCKNVVMLPTRDEAGKLHSFVNENMENYVYFGRTLSNQRVTEGMVKTSYRWGSEENAPAVYAKPIKIKYFSLTNLALGEDGYFYLALDGRVYRAKKLKATAA